MIKKLNMHSLKGLVVALGVLSLTTISCTKTDESLQSNETEIESRKRPSGGGSTGENTGIPQPTGLSASATGPTSVSLSWNSVPNATTYWIIRNGYTPAIVPATSYIDNGVSAGTTYTYSIAAVVNGVRGPISASVTVTTPQ